MNLVPIPAFPCLARIVSRAERYRAVRMRVTTSDGVGLEVVEAGDGPVLLLVHGFTGAKENFTEHLHALARGHRVVAFDHRGHMDSDAPEGADDYSLERLATDVIEVADAVGAETFRLLGHSLGGMVAQYVVLDHPERVDALVLMDTCPGPIPGVDRELAEMAAAIALEQGMPALRERMNGESATGTPAQHRLLRERPEYREFLDRKMDAQSPVSYAVLLRAMLDRPDLSERLRDVACPTLVMVGEEDEMFLPGSVRLARSIPGARLARIPDAGHDPQFENPVSWRHTLEGFLAEIGR